MEIANNPLHPLMVRPSLCHSPTAHTDTALLATPLTPPTLPRPLTCEDGHGGGLPCPIVSQQSRDLALVHVQTQIIHCLLRLGLLEGQKVKKPLDPWLHESHAPRK